MLLAILINFVSDATSYQLVKMNSQDSLNGPDGSNRSENTGGLSGGGIGPAAVPPRNPSELDGIEVDKSKQFVPPCIYM